MLASRFMSTDPVTGLEIGPDGKIDLSSGIHLTADERAGLHVALGDLAIDFIQLQAMLEELRTKAASESQSDAQQALETIRFALDVVAKLPVPPTVAPWRDLGVGTLRLVLKAVGAASSPSAPTEQIGRASCRERV